jgi:hypothetical protein
MGRMTDQISIPDSEDSTFSNTLLGRRRIIAFGLGAAALALSPLKGALAALPQSGTRALSLVSTHTNEHISATYWRDGIYDKGALKDINYVLRDFRTGDVAPIDRHLLDLLVELASPHRQPQGVPDHLRLPLAQDQRHAGRGQRRRCCQAQPAYGSEGDRHPPR